MFVGVPAALFAYSTGAAGTPTTSYLANRRLPLTCRAIVAFDVKLPGAEVMHAPTQPSVYATRKRPCASTSAPLKSSRLRVPLSQPLNPPAQIVPRCTGSFGVALTVVHVCPPSNVSATYRYQTPGHVLVSPNAPPPA